MSYLSCCILGTLFYLYFGEVTVTPQPPYQGVYLYNDTATSLRGLKDCEGIANPENFTIQDLGAANKTTCTDENGNNVTIEFIKTGKKKPVTNSTLARYFIVFLPSYNILPQNTDPGSDITLIETTALNLTCWNGTVWGTVSGWITSDYKYMCCHNSRTSDSCSKLIFLNESGTLEEHQHGLEIRYGFKINYTSNIWPHEELRTVLECGNFMCKFDGPNLVSGPCDITINSIYHEEPLKDMFRNVAVPLYQHPHNLSIEVLYLTEGFLDTEECVVKVMLEGTEVVRSVLQINLTVSEPRVSPSSDIGPIDIAQFLDSGKDPKCIPDGWPVPEAQWMPADFEGLKNSKKKAWRYTKFKSKTFQEPGQEFLCNVTRGNTTVYRHMTLVKVPETNTFSTLTEIRLSEGKTITLHCETKFNDWDPKKPVKLGWTLPNGTEYSLEGDEITLSEMKTIPKKSKIWSFSLTEEGKYKCWAEIVFEWWDPKQRAVLRLESPTITVTKRVSSTGSAQRKTKSTIPEPNTSSSSPPFNYWYLVGLGVLGLFLAISTTFIYKVVKKNQDKVTTLDTKLSLDKVKTMMGVNALYNRVDLTEQEEPLLARIPHIHKEDLVTDRVLGAGQFGKVLKGRLSCTDEDGAPKEIDVAVKCLMHPEQEESTEEFLKEVVMMYHLNHPNVIKLLGICTEYDQYMILSEFMENGNLKDFLMSRERVFSLTDKLYICYQVACGLEHMVTQNIVHRDIAARNCLVGPNLLVKVADFGLSRSLAMSNYYKKVGGQVPIRWMSPEAIKYGRYTKESDVWAFGVLMWEVYTEGHFPYSGYSNEEVQGMLDNGFKLHVPPHCTEDVSVLMQATWETDPDMRPTFKAMRSRLNQMLRNSGMSNILYSSTRDSLPSTSTQGSEDCTLRDPALVCSPTSSRTVCCRDESSTVHCNPGPSTPEVATNRYATEPGICTLETAL